LPSPRYLEVKGHRGSPARYVLSSEKKSKGQIGTEQELKRGQRLMFAKFSSSEIIIKFFHMAKQQGPFLASREKPALSLLLPTWKGDKQKQALDVSLLVSPSKR